MKKVSIIIPVYNSEKYISKCLDSVINQTYKNIEILVINDGSKDNSINILREYEKKDSRIIVIDKENEGVAKTRNMGIKKATGEYIMFIDNDDYIDADYVESFINSALLNDADIVIGGFKRVNIVNGKILYKEKVVDKEYMKYKIITPWARIFKKSFLIKNNIEYFSYGIGEDIYFNLTAYDKSPVINYLKNYGYNWTYNPESVSNTKHKGSNSEIDCSVLLDKLKEYYSGREDEYIYFFYHKTIIWYLLFSGKNRTSDDFVKLYIKLYNWEKDNIKGRIISPLSHKVSGEKIKTRIILVIFNILHKLHLIKLFSKIYCKGE